MELTVCVGDSCHLQGSEMVIRRLKELIKKENLDVNIHLKGSFCMGKCSDKGVTVHVDDQFLKADFNNADDFFYKSILPLVKK